MESMAYIASDKVDKLKIEEFHEFLRRYADIFNKNVTLTKGSTYKNLKNLISKNNIVTKIWKTLLVRIILFFWKVIKTQV